MHIDHAGLSQQSLVINTPKYHKHYILPGNSFYIFYFSINILSTYFVSLSAVPRSFTTFCKKKKINIFWLLILNFFILFLSSFFLLCATLKF